MNEILNLVIKMKEENDRTIKYVWGYRSDDEWRYLEGKDEVLEEIIEAIKKLKN